ncbi:endo-1,4-beta-xylanase [Marinicrinis lubricantis]|uniref:Beta-xylanase n=1 Tax=Marinicrinis lubricantis TaxID=2086470 RepID=A0ABW1IWD6_9BACL
MPRLTRLRGRRWMLIGISGAVIAAVIALLLLYKVDGNGPDEASHLTNTAEGEMTVKTGENAADTSNGHADPEEEPLSNPITAEPKEDPVAASVQTDIPSLAESYADYFPIGAAIEPYQMTGLHADMLKKHMNWLVAENAMKPASLQPREGEFQWEQADRMVQFARENKMELRFHTLVWHNQTPDWFFLDAEGKPMENETDPVKREANKKLLLERLDTHVRTIVERYKDDIRSWDVVNEVIEPADPDGMRASLWYKLTGTEYIETAFRAAREAGGSDIKLYINDYGTDDPVKRDRLAELVTELLDKGVPVDGVGHQTHISIHWPTVDSIIESMRKFHELGLDNLVTELDMSLYAWNDRSDFGEDIPEEILQKQADRYGELFEAFRSNQELLSGVVLWGIADDHTWLSSFPVTRTEAPLLFDELLQAKPAFWAVVDPLQQP